MAFFKPIYKKLAKLWYPQAVSIGKPVSGLDGTGTTVHHAETRPNTEVACASLLDISGNKRNNRNSLVGGVQQNC